MELRHDFTLDIATAHSRLSKKWKNKKWQWSELVARCSETKRTGESVKKWYFENKVQLNLFSKEELEDLRII